MDKKRKPIQFSLPVQVASSTIKKVAFEPYYYILMLHFKSGKKYYYMEVPASTYDALLSAPSKGKYYTQFIKGKFIARRNIDGFFDYLEDRELDEEDNLLVDEDD